MLRRPHQSLKNPRPPQGTRSRHEKLLHERYWTVGHNQSKEARAAFALALVFVKPTVRQDVGDGRSCVQRVFTLPLIAVPDELRHLVSSPAPYDQ